MLQSEGATCVLSLLSHFHKPYKSLTPLLLYWILYNMAKGFKKEKIDVREEADMAELHTDPGAWIKIFTM